eukprot:1987189-Rhodomonas_salina.1
MVAHLGALAHHVVGSGKLNSHLLAKVTLNDSAGGILELACNGKRMLTAITAGTITMLGLGLTAVRTRILHDSLFR